ncbi:MAG TPA: RNA-binding protein [Stellaceae bacterium]|nr:RNA-binding protein [Stellaceae bacterium]
MREDKFRGNVFVANLPKGYTDQQLAEAFDSFGIVVGAFLARDPLTGAPKNHGLVALAPDRAAEAAISALNGTQIGGQRIEVRVADPTMALAIRAKPRPAAPARQEYQQQQPDYPRQAPEYPRQTQEYQQQASEYPRQAPRRTFQVEYRSLDRR